jgi:polyphosphate glucokinase
VPSAGAALPVLVVDVGGSHVKVLATGETQPRRFDSGPALTAAEMVEQVLRLAGDWRWEAVSIGVPAPVLGGKIAHDPVNLGEGWVAFDYEAAFGKPTKVVNDAAMQALGSYEGGKMLFLGFGTGLGSAVVNDGRVEPMELGHLPFRKKTFEDYVGEKGRKRYGRDRWQRAVRETIAHFKAALEPDYIVLGGGNAKRIEELPPGCRLGDNQNAFAGGFRLWEEAAGAA